MIPDDSDPMGLVLFNNAQIPYMSLPLYWFYRLSAPGAVTKKKSAKICRKLRHSCNTKTIAACQSSVCVVDNHAWYAEIC